MESKTKKVRRAHDVTFKIAAVQKLLNRGDRQVKEIAAEVGVIPKLLSLWGKQYGRAAKAANGSAKPKRSGGPGRYDEALRKKGVHLMATRGDTSTKVIAERLGVPTSALQYWAKVANSGSASPSPSAPRAGRKGVESELDLLRAENARLRADRDVLRQVTKIFLESAGLLP
jgi:transposase-like protein